MRQPGSPQAVTAFAIPPHPPPEVAGAKAEFDAIAGRWADVKGELRDAQEALDAAKKADLRAIADAAEKGETVKDAQAKRRKVKSSIDDLQVRLKGLDIAVDEAGDRLAQAIAQHREEWLPLPAKGEADAATRFDQAVTEARKALDELRRARGAVEWLNGFNVDQAHTGNATQYAGGRLRVQSRSGPLRGEHDPSTLLDLAAQVTTTEEAPRSVTIHVPEAAHA